MTKNADQTHSTLNPNQSFSTTVYFLDSIWDNRKELLSTANEEELGCYLSELSSDPGNPEDWVRYYKAVFGKSLLATDRLTPEEIFTTMIEHVARFSYGGIFVCIELLDLLHSMRYKPAQHQREWELWNKAIQRSIKGDIHSYIRFHKLEE